MAHFYGVELPKTIALCPAHADRAARLPYKGLEDAPRSGSGGRSQTKGDHAGARRGELLTPGAHLPRQGSAGALRVVAPRGIAARPLWYRTLCVKIFCSLHRGCAKEKGGHLACQSAATLVRGGFHRRLARGSDLEYPVVLRFGVRGVRLRVADARLRAVDPERHDGHTELASTVRGSRGRKS